MSIKGKAYIAGVYEHPTRKADDKSLAQLHGEVIDVKRATGVVGEDALRRVGLAAESSPSD